MRRDCACGGRAARRAWPDSRQAADGSGAARRPRLDRGRHAGGGRARALPASRRVGRPAEELDAGLSGVSQVELPYAEGGTWTRLGILLATPLTLALAAALAFWPSPGRRGPAPWCGARAPGRSLRGVGYLGVAQLGAAPRPGAPGLYRRIPVARAAARLAGRGGGRRGRDRGDGGAARCRAGRLDRAADQVRGLEDLRRRGGRQLRLGPQLRPARLAPERDRAVRGRGRRATVLLEDRRARQLRRLRLDARGRARGQRGRGRGAGARSSRRDDRDGRQRGPVGRGLRGDDPRASLQRARQHRHHARRRGRAGSADGSGWHDRGPGRTADSRLVLPNHRLHARPLRAAPPPPRRPALPACARPLHVAAPPRRRSHGPAGRSRARQPARRRHRSPSHRARARVGP